MMRDVAGMSVLVTGGGSGIGEGVARYFVERGATVTISGRRADRIGKVAEALGPNCRAVVGDVTNGANRAAMVAAATARDGGLDLLVNGAGNMLRGPITELAEQDILGLFHSNVVGAMMLSGLAVPALEKRRGAIVFFGSVHTRRAFPGASPYAATKGALETLTRVLAAELGPRGIRVNCVVPGAVPTEIKPAGRVVRRRGGGGAHGGAGADARAGPRGHDGGDRRSGGSPGARGVDDQRGAGGRWRPRPGHITCLMGDTR